MFLRSDALTLPARYCLEDRVCCQEIDGFTRCWHNFWVAFACLKSMDSRPVEGSLRCLRFSACCIKIDGFTPCWHKFWLAFACLKSMDSRPVEGSLRCLHFSACCQEIDEFTRCWQKKAFAQNEHRSKPKMTKKTRKPCVFTIGCSYTTSQILP